MVATLGSTMLGFVREVINARFFGASGDMDAFLAAAVVPTILFGVFNGALVTALVPVFSEYFATDREDEAWNLASTLLIVLALGLSVAAAAGAWLDGYVFSLAGPIYAGSNEIQRNIIAERMLGLPR